MMRMSLIGVCCVVYTVGAMATPAEITLETLVRETTDMERLTRWPTAPYTTRQFSSYDRNSTDPSIPTEENWFANYDRNQHLRIEENRGRTEYVLMDTEGPGAVVRFWSANPREGGIVRIYLDHEEEPVIEMPLYVMLGGETKPFIAPFSGERGKGWNSYLPIPYARHCKITISEGDIYYLINYRTYAPTTTVTSFTMAAAETLMPLIRKQAATLASPETAMQSDAGDGLPYDAWIGAGTQESLALSGPAALYRITCAVASEDVEAALRGCVIEIAFDGDAPAVSAPLGDFFGTAPGINAFQSLPLGVLEDGTLCSHWVMPFKDEAVITVTNHTDFDVSLRGELRMAGRAWTDDTLYFHAKWRAEADLPTRPFQDWNYMRAAGRGRYAGVMLHVANPVSQWWGEGDEKIYVDGEVFPSHFGTGSEDYFGYAWCDTTLFTHAYHNQPRCDGPANFGHTCVSRFHIMDDIPFTESFRFDMEVWHWADTQITQAITAYWYAAPGATDNFTLPVPELLTVPKFPEPEGVEGALEGEKLRVLEVGGGDVQQQSSGSWPWSRNMQLWWRDGKPGDRLALGFDVETAGTYEVLAVFTKAPDYGVHQIAVNGVVVGEPMDFYHEDVIVTDEIPLGVFTLAAGENRFEVTIHDRNPLAVSAYMFGLDYLRLSPQ